MISGTVRCHNFESDDRLHHSELVLSLAQLTEHCDGVARGHVQCHGNGGLLTAHENIDLLLDASESTYQQMKEPLAQR